MADEKEKATPIADKIMQELITDVKQYWQDMDKYKRSVGTTIPFSESSTHYQDYIYETLAKGISQARGISLEKARSDFNDFLKESIVAKHISETPSEDGKSLFALKSQLKNEKDSRERSHLKQEFENLKNKVYDNIPETEKTRLLDNTIKNEIIHRHANLKAQVEIDAPSGGYCLKGITESLYKIKNKYGLEFLPENTPENTMPATFLQALREKDENTGKHLYHTDENTTFGQIIEREHIRPGAIVIMDDSNGNPHHAMFWTGQRDENGEPQLIGFNGMEAKEESNVQLSYDKGGKARVGTIIDISALVAVHTKENKSNIYRDKEIQKRLESVREKLLSNQKKPKTEEPKPYTSMPQSFRNFGHDGR